MTIEAVYVPSEGAIEALEAWLNDAIRSPLAAHLYTNNLPFNRNRVVADYTEAAFAGYAPQAITWGPVTIGSTHKAQSQGGNLTWTFSGVSGTHVVYGIYITDQLNTKLCLVVPFLTPIILSPSNRNASYALTATEVGEL